jgi:hypothetical protein
VSEFDAIVGALLGGSAGHRLRTSRVRRKEEHARAGGDVRIRAWAHPTAAPWWTYRRGVLGRRGTNVRWRSALVRWRSFDLREAQVTSVRIRRSAADGDRAILDLRAATPFDHLAVPIDCVGIATALLPGAGPTSQEATP